ncbi:hypothetical protein K439DRAFT_1619501 [Ramaria rubella]|nr:hypothetical protein K439DRAFT_1619501 [Ramaria rubella]
MSAYLNLTQRHYRRMKTYSNCKVISSEEWKWRALAGIATREAIANNIQEFWDFQNEKAQELATKHKKSLKWMQAHLMRHPGTLYGRRSRKSNVYNAYQHVKNMDIDEDLPEADNLKLQEFKNHANATEYKDLSSEYLHTMREILDEHCARATIGVRALPTAQALNVRKTYDRIVHELSDLEARCMSSAILVIVPSALEAIYDPMVYASNSGDKFLEMVYNLQKNELASKFMGFTMSGIRGLKLTNKERVKLLKAHCVKVIQDKLRAVTKDRSATMSYASYESSIVDRYCVKLEGWPFNKFHSPAAMNAIGDLERLQVRLDREENERGLRCYFCKLSQEEYEDRKQALDELDETPKKRKERSDKGKSHGPYRRNSNIEHSSDDDESSTTGSETVNSESEAVEEMSRVSTKRKRDSNKDNITPSKRQRKGRVVSSKFVNDDSE